LTRTNRFFRWVWRINALLIFVAAAAAAIGVIVFAVSQISSSLRERHVATVEPQLTGKAATSEMHLSGFSQVEGTSIFRATLSSAATGGYKLSSSSRESETRNIQIVDFATAKAKWLLPATNELITYNEDIVSGSEDHKSHPLATVVLVKSSSSDPTAVEGRLLLMDIAAQHVHEVATNVREVKGAALMESGEVAILFEQSRKYELALFDAGTLEKHSQREIPVPELR
jgi:hypothetical protein